LRRSPLVDEYFRTRESALRGTATTAVLNAVELGIGSVDHLRQETEAAAMQAWDQVIENFFRRPVPDPDPVLRNRVCLAVIRKAELLGWRRWTDQHDEDRAKLAIAAYRLLVNTFGKGIAVGGMGDR
jgi:hypothetical protein